MSRSSLHPVQAAILERRESESRPTRRADTHRIGLVVEGGMMRGVVSAGMLLGLEALGLRDSFDVVYGSSAGAANAAYFLSGQGRAGIPLYFDCVSSRAFADPLRLLRREPVVDLDFVYSHIATEVLPIDWPALHESGIRLVVSAACVDAPDDTSVLPIAYLSDFAGRDDLLGCLRASAQFPLLAGDVFGYRGSHFADAGIAEPVPLAAAIAEGCSHILVLRTVTQSARPRRLYALEMRLEELAARRLSLLLANLIRRRRATYEATRALLRHKQVSREGPPFISTIVLPERRPRVHLLEMRRSVLIAAARDGMIATLRSFDQDDGRAISQVVASWIPEGRACFDGQAAGSGRPLVPSQAGCNNVGAELAPNGGR